jgi:hypothetical protein
MLMMGFAYKQIPLLEHTLVYWWVRKLVENLSDILRRAVFITHSFISAISCFYRG